MTWPIHFRAGKAELDFAGNVYLRCRVDTQTGMIDRGSKAGIAMTDFTPFQSLLGGALIGLSAVLLMAFHGRIAGMTGILTGDIPLLSPQWRWRVAFLAGAIVALLIQLAGKPMEFSVPVPTSALVGGFLVGIDKQLVGGAAVSGIGWGIAGFCPGGAIPALGLGHSATLVFIAAVIAGIVMARFARARLAQPAAA